MCTRHIEGKQQIVERIQWKQLHHTFVVEENAELHALFVVDNSTCGIDIQCVWPHSKASVTCIFLSKDGEKSTAKVFGNLKADHSAAELYLLSFLGEKADVQVDGGVNIAPDIKQASGHLLEENIVLGKKIKVKTLPMLDVRSSDVSASHGAKIDRLDESKLFYMMAKGLDQKQAQKLIVEWYIQRACEAVNMAEDSDERKQIVSDIFAYLHM